MEDREISMRDLIKEKEKLVLNLAKKIDNKHDESNDIDNKID
jgi:hypothetical protein